MTEFIAVVFLHMFAVMSPGPDFFLITRQSLRHGRNVTIWTAFGIGSGILFHSILAITGIVLLITGILILTNQLQAIGFYIIKIFPFMQNFG